VINQQSKTLGSAPVPQNGRVSRRSLLIGSAAVSAAWPTSSFAQSASEANEIIRSLAPIQGQTVTPGYSGLRRQPVQIDRTTIYVDVSHSVALEVYFDFGSATITGQARAQLTSLGRALSSPQLAPYRYLIAGHTDAVGSNNYNLELSQRRASAVRDDLIATFPIDPDRLATVGFGFRHLKRPNAPRAAINRRVEVLLIVP
jgi:OOP family OmpA-OmpF porin